MAQIVQAARSIMRGVEGRAFFDFQQHLSVRHSLACCLLLVITYASLHAAAQQPLPNPNLILTSNAVIGSAALQPDGKLLILLSDGARIGGRFLNNDFTGVDRASLARLNADGSLDTSFTVDTPDDSLGIFTVRVFGNFAYVLGQFTQIGGVPRAGLARINLTTNAVDPNWNPNPVSRVAGQIAVGDIALDGQGNLYTFGSIYDIGGKTNVRVAKIPANSINGVADPNFSGAQASASLAFDIVANRILASPSGAHIYLFGRLAAAQATQNFRIYRLDATTGLPALGWPADPTAIDMNTFDVAIDTAGDIYIAGQSSGTAVTGQGLTSPYSIVKLSGVTGQVPSTWTGGRNVAPFAPGAIVPSYTPRAHYNLVIDNNGLYAMRGIFYSDFVSVQPVRLDPATGEPILSFAGQAMNGSNLIPRVIIPASDGLIVGGPTNYYGTARTGTLVKLDYATGTVVPTFNPNVKTLGYISASTKQADGRVVLGGAFTEANGVALNNLLRLNTDGTLDSTFTNGPNSPVNAVKDIGGSLYVSGLFEFVGNTPRQYLAKFSGTTGAFDPGWVPRVDGLVRGFTGDASGIYTIGGTYTVNGSPGRCVAKLSPTDGSLDAAWSPPVTNVVFGSVCNRGIEKIGSQIYIGLGGASRITVNGQPRSVARVDASTGAVDTSFDSATNSGITVMHYDGSDLWVGGTFLSFGGVTTARLAKINASGRVDPNFVVSPTELTTSMGALRGGPNGVFVSLVSGVPNSVNQAYQLIKYNAITGKRDPAYSPTFDQYRFGSLSAVEFLPGNRIVVGAGFDAAGGQRRLGVAAFSTVAPAKLTLTVNGRGTVDATSSGGAANVQCFDCKGGPFNYEFDIGSTVTLTAKPVPGWTFIGWKGDNGVAACTSPAPCQFTLNAPTNVSASFRNVSNFIEQ